jgi:hypothetical protein
LDEKVSKTLAENVIVEENRDFAKKTFTEA